MQTPVNTYQGKYINTLIKVVEKGIRSSEWWRRNSALELFNKLVEKGRGFPEAIAAAQAGMGGENLYSALLLFGKLFRQGQGIAEATIAAQAGLSSANEDVRRKALSLFDVLIKKGWALSEAAQVAKDLQSNSNPDVVSAAQKLAAKLPRVAPL